jgi:hypothetical protein
VEYEPDTYRKAILQDGIPLKVNSVLHLTATNDPFHAKFALGVETEGRDLRDIYSINSPIECAIPFYYHLTTPTGPNTVKSFLTTGTVTAVSENTIEAVLGPYSQNDDPEVGPNGNNYLNGNIFLNENYNNTGGGYRVKSVSIDDKIKETSKSMHYDYTLNGVTTGVTSYEPNIAEKLTFDYGDEELDDFVNKTNFSRIENIFQSSREVPVPGVMYGSVIVSEKVQKGELITDGLTSVQYKYQVLDENMIGYEVQSTNTANVVDDHYGIHFEKVVKKDIVLKDYTQLVGSLKSITTFDRLGNKISETINEYLHDKIQNFEQKSLNQINTEYNSLLNNFANQGVIHESAWSGRFAKIDSKYELFGILSRRQVFPLIQTGQHSMNFKTGVSTRTENREFDFYTGQVTKSASTDPYGNTYVTQTIPAYRKHHGMGLGLMGGMNMLSQEAATYVYKVDGENQNSPVGLVSASAQTWSGQIPILDQPDLQQQIVVQLAPKGEDGFFNATDPAKTNKLRIGEQVKFTWDGVEYLAKVMSSNISDNWNYGLRIIGIEPAISSSLNNIPLEHISAYKSHQNFSFIGDNYTAMGNDGLKSLPENILPQFDAWNSNTVPIGWQKNGEVTLYDVYSHALEGVDLNGNYSATKMSSDQTRVFASASNSLYNEFAYSGAEDDLLDDGTFGGDVRKGEASVVSVDVDPAVSHTGRSALHLENVNDKAFHYIFTTLPNKAYHASVWVNSLSGRLYYKQNGIISQSEAPSNGKQAGNWFLIDINIPKTVQSSTVEVWAGIDGTSCNFDDFRVCPFDASMTSFVYNKWGEVSHILNANNLFVEYRYDDLGRLTETFQETFIERGYGSNSAAKRSEIVYKYGLNNPFLIDMVASSSGSSGTIVPYGTSQVMRDNSITYELATNCSSNFLTEVLIDGQSIDMSQSSFSLSDGTLVSISDRRLTFHSVKSSHTIHATYNNPVATLGMIRCYNSYEYYGTGADCFDGSYEYSYYDECGQLTELFRVFDWQSIPPNIRDSHQQSSYSCCEMNGNNGCACQ